MGVGVTSRTVDVFTREKESVEMISKRVYQAVQWLYKQAMGLRNEKENNKAIQIADKSPLRRVLPTNDSIVDAIEGSR
jgi:hypothetical protein